MFCGAAIRPGFQGSRVAPDRVPSKGSNVGAGDKILYHSQPQRMKPNILLLGVLCVYKNKNIYIYNMYIYTHTILFLILCSTWFAAIFKDKPGRASSPHKLQDLKRKQTNASQAPRWDTGKLSTATKIIVLQYLRCVCFSAPPRTQHKRMKFRFQTAPRVPGWNSGFQLPAPEIETRLHSAVGKNTARVSAHQCSKCVHEDLCQNLFKSWHVLVL